MTKKSPNICPSCGEPHAFSIMDAEEAQLYVPEDEELPSDDPEATYRVYICPEQEDRVIALA